MKKVPPTFGFANKHSLSSLITEKIESLDLEKEDPTAGIAVEALAKDEYLKLLRNERKKFVHELWPNELRILFENLRADALKMKHCHREFTVESPYAYDVIKIEAVLCSYFSDLGYKPLTEARKVTDDDSSHKITITIT